MSAFIAPTWRRSRARRPRHQLWLTRSPSIQRRRRRWRRLAMLRTATRAGSCYRRRCPHHAVQCTDAAETATLTEDVQVGIVGVLPSGRGSERRATTAGAISCRRSQRNRRCNRNKAVYDEDTSVYSACSTVQFTCGYIYTP